MLAALARADTIKEAAFALAITPDTIKGTKRAIFTKLDVTTQDGAFRSVGWLIVPTDDELAA